LDHVDNLFISMVYLKAELALQVNRRRAFYDLQLAVHRAGYGANIPPPHMDSVLDHGAFQSYVVCIKITHRTAPFLATRLASRVASHPCAAIRQSSEAMCRDC